MPHSSSKPDRSLPPDTARHRPVAFDTEEKPGPIQLPEALPLLQGLGLATAGGEIKVDKRRKFNQINRFIELVAPILQRGPRRRITILDCGCGKSFLSFALNYYLREKLDRKCHFWGVDANPERIRQAETLRERLGYDNMTFIAGRVAAFQPPEPMDGVLSLHACDTATDEALAKGIELEARFILAVPCCQSELLNQMKQHPLSDITRHGVYAYRLADLLTDGLRTLALEAAGYDTSVVEFISAEDTPKNLLIRAERKSGRNTVALHKYWELVNDYNVDPALQRFLPWLKPRRVTPPQSRPSRPR